MKTLITKSVHWVFALSALLVFAYLAALPAIAGDYIASIALIVVLAQVVYFDYKRGVINFRSSRITTLDNIFKYVLIAYLSSIVVLAASSNRSIAILLGALAAFYVFQATYTRGWFSRGGYLYYPANIFGAAISVMFISGFLIGASRLVLSIFN